MSDVSVKKGVRKPKETVDFETAYAKLSEVSQKLREARAPMVDTLLPLVEEAVAAKKVCDERIQAVRKLLSERLGE